MENKTEAKDWFDRAELDFSAAKKSIGVGEVSWAGVQLQQAIEKALKAVLLLEKDRLFKTHDLSVLAMQVKLPENFLDDCEEISLLYLSERYPDVPRIENLDKKITKYLKTAEEILKWAKDKI